MQLALVVPKLKLPVFYEINISHNYTTSFYFIRPLSFSLYHDPGNTVTQKHLVSRDTK